jgi:hypothetical protein
VSVFDKVCENKTNILKKISDDKYFKDLMEKCIEKIKNCKKDG